MGAAALLSVSVVGCSADSESVPWEDYSPNLETQIDNMVAEQDCEGLRKEFEAADSENEAMKSRTGHDNTDLLAYLDASMLDAGCYEE